MHSRWPRLRALFCLLLIVQHVSGEVFRVVPRADDNPEKTTAIDSSTTSTRGHSTATKTSEVSARQTELSDASESQSQTESISVTATETEKTQSSDPASTSTDGSLESGLDDSSYYNGIDRRKTLIGTLANIF